MGSLLANLPGMVYRCCNDPDWTLIFANRGCQELTGYSAEELVQKVVDFGDLIHPEDRDPVWEDVQAGVSERRPFHLRYRIVARGGILKWVAEQGHGVFSPDGELLYLEGFISDITGRVLAETSLERSERLFRTLAGTAPVGIFRTDPGGRCVYVNERWCEITGMTQREAAGEGWATALHPEDRERVSVEWNECAQQGRVFQSEYRFRRPDGRTTWVLGQSAPEQGPQGEIAGHVGTLTDISARKGMEEELLRSMEEKNVLLREIHHRVKNNLQIVASLLYLQGAELSPPQRLKFEESRGRVQTMGLLHETLFSTGQFSHVDAKAYFERLVSAVKTIHGERAKVELVSRIEPVSLSVDAAIPCGLILNELVTNALKHAFPSARRGRIDIGLNASETGCVLEVRDDGVGLDAVVDLDQPETLGLRLVRSLAEQMDAELRVERGQGTAYSLRFRS